MNIQPVKSPAFGVRVNTFHVFELTTLTMFEPDGFMGMTQTMKKLYNVPKVTGSKGYRYYANIVGIQIQQKYPKIAEITRILKQTIKDNPKITRGELHSKVATLAAKIGEEIEIVI